MQKRIGSDKATAADVSCADERGESSRAGADPVANQRSVLRERDLWSHGLVAFRLAFVREADAETRRLPSLRLINYHFGGACFEISARDEALWQDINPEDLMLELVMGTRVAKSKVRFRVCWETEPEGVGMGRVFGVEFLRPVRGFSVIRARRFRANPNFLPTLCAKDPVDPHRQIFFQILELSETGLLLSTSLTNRHLLEGMRLEHCVVSTPGKSVSQAATFRICNTRPADSGQENMFYLGVAIEKCTEEYAELIRGYLAAFSLSIVGNAQPESRIESLSRSAFVGKRLKDKLTYRVIRTETEYEELLKLRFKGYGHHGKVKSGSTWRDQGESLAAEGSLVCAYLGGEMIASMEFRFLENTAEMEKMRANRYIDVAKVAREQGLQRVVEINKLVIHPKAQGSDVVVGLIQKVHAIMVARGGYDILILATPKLTALYQRIGFSETGVTCPHPTLPNTHLNLLLLRRDTYMRAQGINPYAWSVVYEIGQSYFEELGIAKPVKFGTPKKLVRFITQKVVENRERRMRRRELKKSKSKRDSSAPPTTEAREKLARIDAKWTAQHFAAEIMLPYILQAEEMVGVQRVALILKDLGVPRDYFLKHGNWISIPFLDAFLDAFADFGSASELSRLSGARAMQADILGVKYYVLKHFLSPEDAFRISAKVLSKFNLTRTYTVFECNPGKVRIALGLTQSRILPKHRSSCLNWENNFAAYVKLMTGQEARIAKISCCYSGDAACTYDIQWKATTKTFIQLLKAMGVIVGAGSVYWIWQSFWAAESLAVPVILGLVTGIAALGYKVMRLQRGQKAINAKIEQSEQASNERYSQLQTSKEELERRYHELVLLQEASTAVMKNNDLRQILSVTLKSICDKFSFSRAFVMLVNEDKSFLRMEAIHGIGEHLEKLWNFKVNIQSMRDTPLVMSSVYHTGNPVMVRELKDHAVLLNESSRKLIAALGAESFIMVPVPSSNGCWGVMVADKGKDKVSENDVELLQRVSHQMGIALDKQAMLEDEKREKEYFKKFVPAYETTKIIRQSGSLGWELRETVAMFIDISGYTATIDTLSPSAAAAMVNGFYELVHASGRKHGAYTDKFIGDAVLLTWGYTDAIAGKADAPVQCALQILGGLKELNAELGKSGIPPIDLRIGIFRGTAVCGLFGCEERMEFTGIGSTLNAASRLQSLCKEHSAKIAISESLIAGLSHGLLAGWQIVEGISLRGLSKPTKVGFYKNG